MSNASHAKDDRTEEEDDVEADVVEEEEDEDVVVPVADSEDDEVEESAAGRTGSGDVETLEDAALETEETEALDGVTDEAGALLRGVDERGADDLGGTSPPPPDVPAGADEAGMEDAGTLLDAGAGGSFVMLKLLLWSGASWRQDTSPCIWKLGEPCVTPAALPGPVSCNMNVALCAAITAPVKAQKPVAARSSEREVPMTERMRVMG